MFKPVFAPREQACTAVRIHATSRVLLGGAPRFTLCPYYGGDPMSDMQKGAFGFGC